MRTIFASLCLVAAAALPATADTTATPVAVEKDADGVTQLGVNAGLLQLALGGANVAADVRFGRLWLEYSHGMNLTMNKLGGGGLTSAESRDDLHVHVPWTTGFGVGAFLVDNLWAGVEFKAHRFEVNAPSGAVNGYRTYSIGPMIGYRLFLYRGLHVNAYVRYWPNVATSLSDDEVMLTGERGPVTHTAHSFDLFANVSLGYAFDL